MDFRRQRGFLLNGEDPPEKVGCRKESYFLEFMCVDVARILFCLVETATKSTCQFRAARDQVVYILGPRQAS